MIVEVRENGVVSMVMTSETPMQAAALVEFDEVGKAMEKAMVAAGAESWVRITREVLDGERGKGKRERVTFSIQRRATGVGATAAEAGAGSK